MLEPRPLPGGPVLLTLVALVLAAGCSSSSPTAPAPDAQPDRAVAPTPERALAELGTQGQYGPTEWLERLPEGIIPSTELVRPTGSFCGFGFRPTPTKPRPMYMIDGETWRGGESELAPERIAAIELLPAPAATALFGSRGLYGIIFVTTYPQ